MAFLDNSGDIILDAVLTDLGRHRLAAGTFSITKFALGDEEINYALYNSAHPSGSSHYDLEILKTPILEAFTADQSLMKSRLITLTKDNILYMPIFKLNNKYADCQPDASLGGFNIMADSTTFNVDNNATNTAPSAGYLHGVEGEQSSTTTHICVDQGIDSSDSGMSIATEMDPGLREDSYLIKMDSRLLRLDAFLSKESTPRVDPAFIDDDAIATYYIKAGAGRAGGAVMGKTNFAPRTRGKLEPGMAQEDLTPIAQKEMFAGPLGNVLRLTPRASTQVQQGTSLFDELGSSGTNLSFRGATISTYKFIDTTINVTGVSTGYSIDIPIRLIKGLTFSS